MPTLTGTGGSDNMIGSTDDDIINALGGNDQLSGNDGNDTMDGGSGDDVLTGGAGIDIMTGGTDVDRFRDTVAGLNGDRITDFLPGDRIQITDLDVQTAMIGITATSITFNGGSVNVDNLGPGRLLIRGIQGGGVEIRLQQIAQNDFNGDGRSDVLWRHDDGSFTTWLAQAGGGFVSNDANSWHSIPTAWRVIGTGDFNGDGSADVLWRNSDGSFTNWLAGANGSFTSNDANAWTMLPNTWQVDGVGDFNGDGRDDLIWRRDDGAFTTWLAQPNGGFVSNDANSWTMLTTSWQVVGTGDFNGDGRSDIVWRRDDGAFTTWLAQANGGFVSNDANAFTTLPTAWRVDGVGDFNGDGSDDLVWRNTDGSFTTWLSGANGSFVSNDANSFTSLPNSWQIVEVGDYNGDGRDDILWRRDDGAFTSWLAQGNGSFVSNDANAFTTLPTAWHVQGPDTFWP